MRSVPRGSAGQVRSTRALLAAPTPRAQFKASVPDGLGLLVPSWLMPAARQRAGSTRSTGRAASVQPWPRPQVHATGHTHTAHAHTEWRRPAPSAAVEWPPPEIRMVDTRINGAKQVGATATRGPGRCRAKGCTKTCCGRPQGPTTHHHRPGRVLGDRSITRVRK